MQAAIALHHSRKVATERYPHGNQGEQYKYIEEHGETNISSLPY